MLRFDARYQCIGLAVGKYQASIAITCFSIGGTGMCRLTTMQSPSPTDNPVVLVDHMSAPNCWAATAGSTRSMLN